MAYYVPFVERLVKSMIARGKVRGELDELTADGMFGLADAIGKFDGERRIRFESFAALRIMGSVIDAARKLDWVPRLERRREKAGLLTPAAMLKEADGEFVHDDEGRPRGLDAADPRAADWQADVDFRLDLTAFVEEFGGLSRTERAILRLRYLRGLRMKAIGERLGLCESRVCQITADLHRRFGDRLPAGRRASS
jgi:RNA polymerase sigma factor (sigma-70 family)